MRNVAFPFRASPVNDDLEMYELHSEDPALELTPGRYALVLKNQAYEFTVEGEPVDPRQCIERIVASNGTFYSDCKKP
jgi:beta-galactosidase beta subunit